MRLVWTAEAAVADTPSVFMHLVGPDGAIVTQSDHALGGDFYPAAAWEAGDWVEDQHVLPTPQNLAAGEYELITGLYNPATGQRLPLDNGATTLGLQRWRLASGCACPMAYGGDASARSSTDALSGNGCPWGIASRGPAQPCGRVIQARQPHAGVQRRFCPIPARESPVLDDLARPPVCDGVHSVVERQPVGLPDQRPVCVEQVGRRWWLLRSPAPSVCASRT